MNHSTYDNDEDSSLKPMHSANANETLTEQHALTCDLVFQSVNFFRSSQKHFITKHLKATEAKSQYFDTTNVCSEKNIIPVAFTVCFLCTQSF